MNTSNPGAAPIEARREAYRQILLHDRRCRRQEICQAWFEALLGQLPFTLRVPWFDAGPFRGLGEHAQRLLQSDPEEAGEATPSDGGTDRELPEDEQPAMSAEHALERWCFASKRLGMLTQREHLGTLAELASRLGGPALLQPMLGLVVELFAAT